jgi:hypothetical protein
VKDIFTQSDLNLRQHIWLEMTKGCDLEVYYHPGKVNVVADAHSRKSYDNIVQTTLMSKELLKNLSC